MHSFNRAIKSPIDKDYFGSFEEVIQDWNNYKIAKILCEDFSKRLQETKNKV
jgi:hypothetical protein